MSVTPIREGDELPESTLQTAMKLCRERGFDAVAIVFQASDGSSGVILSKMQVRDVTFLEKIMSKVSSYKIDEART